ncbi:hypothetical protein O3P69_019556 [Scylla paramamosain]|uniref:Uncharacterized protein n=1 Tax=Scylla paramamosain TaxID=85552 RepID=A0AAW0SW64_SCYPA
MSEAKHQGADNRAPEPLKTVAADSERCTTIGRAVRRGSSMNGRWKQQQQQQQQQSASGSSGTCCEREGRPVHRCAALCLDVPGSLLRLYHSCPYYQASIQAAALPGTDGCLASPRVPAGLDAACAGGSGAAVEVVKPGNSMSGRRRREQRQQQQQQQPASGSPGTCCEREGRPVHRCAALCLDVPGSLLRLYHSCPYYQASIQAAALPGTDGCLASPRVPAGLDAACAGGSGAAVEVVRPGNSMSGRRRRQQRQQQQPASGVGRRSHLDARYLKRINRVACCLPASHHNTAAPPTISHVVSVSHAVTLVCPRY